MNLSHVSHISFAFLNAFLYDFFMFIPPPYIFSNQSQCSAYFSDAIFPDFNVLLNLLYLPFPLLFPFSFPPTGFYHDASFMGSESVFFFFYNMSLWYLLSYHTRPFLGSSFRSISFNWISLWCLHFSSLGVSFPFFSLIVSYPLVYFFISLLFCSFLLLNLLYFF